MPRSAIQIRTVSCNSPVASLEFTQSILESGFAVVSDHGIPFSLITDSFKEWEDFFASQEKHEYTFNTQTQAGYFPFRSENAKDYSKKDLKEFFHFYPARNELPKKTQTHTPQLYQKLHDLSVTLLGWIQENTPDHVRMRYSEPLTSMIQGSEETLLRPIHYPPLTGSEEEGAVRAAAHEDINLITLLPAATAPGLQVKDLNGNWIDVPCDPGTIVVNSGDMLKMASGDYFPSTTHQVVNPRGPASQLPRYSMPLFLHPRSNVRLSEKHTSRSYLEERLTEIGLLKKKSN
jgi:isopenicillin N synthase-like dioxygenase